MRMPTTDDIQYTAARLIVSLLAALLALAVLAPTTARSQEVLGPRQALRGASS